MTPISNQLKEHQTLLERRVENLKKLSGDLSSLQERLHQLETQKMALGKQVEDLLRIKYKVLGTADRQRVGESQGRLSAFAVRSRSPSAATLRLDTQLPALALACAGSCRRSSVEEQDGKSTESRRRLASLSAGFADSGCCAPAPCSRKRSTVPV